MSAALLFRAAFDGLRSAIACRPSFRFGSWTNDVFTPPRVYSILCPLDDYPSLIKFVPRVASICEDDLIDDYVHDDLTPVERQEFETHFLNTPEHRRI